MMSLQIGNLNIVRLSWKLQLDFEIEFSIISSWSSVGLLFVGGKQLGVGQDETDREDQSQNTTTARSDFTGSKPYWVQFKCNSVIWEYRWVDATLLYWPYNICNPKSLAKTYW